MNNFGRQDRCSAPQCPLSMLKVRDCLEATHGPMYNLLQSDPNNHSGWVFHHPVFGQAISETNGFLLASRAQLFIMEGYCWSKSECSYVVGTDCYHRIR